MRPKINPLFSLAVLLGITSRAFFSRWKSLKEVMELQALTRERKVVEPITLVLNRETKAQRGSRITTHSPNVLPHREQSNEAVFF